jgi:hypothetical protein
MFVLKTADCEFAGRDRFKKQLVVIGEKIEPFVGSLGLDNRF